MKKIYCWVELLSRTVSYYRDPVMVPKKELKVAASVDTSKLAAKMILIKTKTYDLDSNKLKNVPAH